MELRWLHLILPPVLAFVAWGYITDYFPRLLYLPWAFLAGIAFAIVFAAWIILSTARRLPSVEDRDGTIANARLAFVQPQAWPAERDGLKRRLQYWKTPVYPQSREISKSADALLDLVIRDFVTSWYQHVSKQPYFQNEVDKAIRAALSDILSRIVDLDVIELLVSRFVPIVTKHLHEFDEAETAVRGRKLSRTVTESDELNMAIAGRYDDGRLHTAAALVHSNLKLVQQQYLRGIVTRLLPKVLPEQMTKSAAVVVLIKEIVACAVLYPIMDMLTEPDFWYQQVENYGRSLLQERKTIRKLRAALDEHAPNSTQPRTNVQFPKLEPGDSERRFERFVRVIRKLNNLSDARRFRSEVATQLMRDADVEGQDALYLRRLEAAKRLLDQRIATMATAGSIKGKPAFDGSEQKNASSRRDDATLREVLYSATGLSSFMEYMDRQHLMRLVQFWIVVDGIRNPLDADDANADDTDNFTESDRNDLIQINEAYMPLPEINAVNEAKEVVRQFVKAGNYASNKQYHAARRAVLQTQTAAYELMQHPHYDNFRKSDLYYKWLASDEGGPRLTAPAMERTNSSPMQSTTSVPPRPQAVPRHSSAALKAPLRGTDLRRAVASSSDLKAFVKSSSTETPPRRSLEDNKHRQPLFDDDDDDTDPLAQSTASLDSEPEPRQSLEGQTRAVNAMQAALTDIMVAGPEKDSLFSEHELDLPQEIETAGKSVALPRVSMTRNQSGQRPNLASLGLVGAPRAGGFLEENLFGEEQKFPEDDRADSDTNDKTEGDGIVEAAPGDLGLAEAIDALTLDIEKLVTQESIVDSLTNKAELTNNAAELRILKKSKASLQREINRKELQRQQYIVQESDNSLYGRAKISIQSIMVGQEEDGKEFAMYVIEVRRQAGEQMAAAAWVVARRYSEFHDLNKRLRSRFPVVRSMEFPRRQVVLKLQKDFLQKRKLALERYLGELLRVPAICRSRELRAFLSEQAITPVDSNGQVQVDTRDFVTRIYNSVTDGMEEFLGNIPVLDQLSLAGQNLISAATTQLNQAPPSLTALPHPMTASATNARAGESAFGGDLGTAAEADAELRAFESKELEPFVKPIADLFLEAFELNREKNWLRGRAVVVVLHQLLGSTIERRVRDLGRQHLSEEAVVKYLDLAREMMWPDGKMRVAGEERTKADKDTTRKEATLALATLVPEVVGSVVGRGNASSASRRIIALLGNKRLNAHLVFTMLDEIIKVVFDEQ